MKYTKKQIVEAIDHWKKELAEMDETPTRLEMATDQQIEEFKNSIEADVLAQDALDKSKFKFYGGSSEVNAFFDYLVQKLDEEIVEDIIAGDIDELSYQQVVDALANRISDIYDDFIEYSDEYRNMDGDWDEDKYRDDGDYPEDDDF